MTLDLTHLPTAIREHAFDGNTDRIRQVRAANWVGYARATRALDRLEELIEHPPCARMPCLLIYGESGMGKTMIVEKFLRIHPPLLNSAYTICQRHAVPLVLDVAARSEEGAEETSPIELTVLERNLLAHLMRFESQIQGAWRGNAPVEAAGTLTAGDFLRVVQDLSTFGVARWDAGRFPRAQTVEQQAYHLGFHAPTLFPRHQLKRSKYYRERRQPMQLRHLADPAARRAALWLVLQVIWYVPSGPPRLALRLGVTPQDEFFGSRRHAGWAWLTERALAWPSRYRARHWHGFGDVTDTLKVQLTPLKG